MKVQEVMTEGPASVRSTTSVREAFEVLKSLNVRHVPIVDARGELVGILSDRDQRSFWSHDRPNGGSDEAARLELPVCTVMSTVPFAVRPDADVQEVAKRMIDQRIGAVPVLSADGALIGIVSYVDLLREWLPFAPDAWQD